MAAAEWSPTPRQMLRAALKILACAVALPFLRKRTRATTYTIAGQNISGKIYYSKSNSPAPAVLLLPTAMGLTPHEHTMACRLAREGYTVLALAYTKRTTGAVVKNPERRKLLQQMV